MEDYAKLFEGLSVDEINDRLSEIREAATSAKKAIRDANKADVKAAKEAKKAKAVADAKEALKSVEAGSVVKAVFKGEVVEAEFVKLNDKTFTAVVNGVKKAIGYDKFVFEVEEAEKSVAV